MINNIVKVVFTAFGIILVVLGVVAIVAVTTIRRSVTTSDWVNHTHAVMLETGAIVASLHAGDASLRSYLLTADKRDQSTYRIRYHEMTGHLNTAKDLTRQEPDSRQQILNIEELISRRIDLSGEVARSFESEGRDVATRKLQGDAGSILIAEIQLAAQKLTEGQKELLRQRDKASYLQAQATRWTVWSGLGLNFLLVVFLGWLIRDDIDARRKAATALEQANESLEQKVLERTAELVRANENLNEENLARQWSEQALAHQLHYSDLIINLIDDHIFVISKELNILRVNPAVVHTTGYDLPEIVINPVTKILDIPEPPAGDETAPIRFIQAVKEGREIQGRRGNLKCKNGTVMPMCFNMIPLRDQNKIVGGVLTVHIFRERRNETDRAMGKKS